MKRFVSAVLLVTIALSGWAEGSGEGSEIADRATVREQQAIYGVALPVPLYDYSIPRDVFIQIYDVVTTKAYVTYTVVASMTGAVMFHGPSIGYALPADTSLTNPLKRDGSSYGYTSIEQAEPNGLYSSKNTDGTWVLFLNDDGTVTPVYTEMKVTTFPFSVVQESDGSWTRADNRPSDFTVDVGQ